MNKFRLTFLWVLSFLSAIPAIAQNRPEMADTMRAEGKIYVVVAIILIVLAGLFVYLFLIDKKVRHLENTLREKHSQTK